MDSKRVQEILADIRQVKIAVYGDFCIDAYWMLDPRGSEVSVETGLQGQAVSRHYYSLGGASNVVGNLAALQPQLIQVIGVIGDDIFGRELNRQLEQLGVDTGYLAIQKENFDTVTFGKPYLENNELARMDFGFFNQRSQETDDILIESIRTALESVDVLIMNQQVPGSIPRLEFIERANELFAGHQDKIILLDSRHYGDKFKYIYRKTNDIEAARLNGVEADRNDVVRSIDCRRYARQLYKQYEKPVFVTRGARGLIIADATGEHEVAGIQLLGRLDPVGAGDTTISALALSLAAGVDPLEAGQFANFASAVTVQKLFQTGTASPEEIVEISRDASYIYQPELAEDPRQAAYIPDTEIEICCERQFLESVRIKHAVFDHDGTISTLRQGWEKVMEPVMIQAILGEQYNTADETLYHKARNRVREYIDQSTGIQTILQMEALVEMVREFGIVPEDEILDKFGYKLIYNDALMSMVNRRMEKFRRGELDLQDFTIKGSVDWLRFLRDKGVTLYLASGTDREDVVSEAGVLGYADLFNGGIYGAVGDVSKYSKKMVLENILRDNHLSGEELAVWGDGPVEIRECRKRGGLAIGIASDEIRRYGLSRDKRSRLIKAGAHIIIPDFTQREQLAEVLF